MKKAAGGRSDDREEKRRQWRQETAVSRRRWKEEGQLGEKITIVRRSDDGWGVKQ